MREPGSYVSICKMPGALLRPGRYRLSVGAHIGSIKVFGYYENVLAFDISEVGYCLNLNRGGIVTPLLAWDIRRAETVT